MKVPEVTIIDAIVVARQKMESAQALWTCNKIAAVREALKDLKTAKAYVEQAIRRMAPYVDAKYLPK